MNPRHADYDSAALTTLKYIITDSYLHTHGASDTITPQGSSKVGNTFERDMVSFSTGST